MSLKKGARVIVETCMGIKPNENVLIIMTRIFSKKAKILAELSEELGARVNTMLVEEEEMEIEPPKKIAEAMKKSEVVLATLPFRLIQIFLHTNARREATDLGARVAAVPYIKYDITREDILEITDLTEKLAEILTNGGEARIQTQLGTDVTLSIKGRTSAPLRVMHVVPGAWGAVPDYAEAAIAPVEGSARGKWIIDVFFEKVGAIKTPVEILIEDGRAIEISGGEEADKIKKIIKAADKNGNNIAELGIGTNHRLKLVTGTIGDKMVKGTAHLAIGKNINIGGNIYSNIHHDGVMKDVTIEIDGKKIIDTGNVLI